MGVISVKRHTHQRSQSVCQHERCFPVELNLPRWKSRIGDTNLESQTSSSTHRSLWPRIPMDPFQSGGSRPNQVSGNEGSRGSRSLWSLWMARGPRMDTWTWASSSKERARRHAAAAAAVFTMFSTSTVGSNVIHSLCCLRTTSPFEISPSKCRSTDWANHQWLKNLIWSDCEFWKPIFWSVHFNTRFQLFHVSLITFEHYLKIYLFFLSSVFQKYLNYNKIRILIHCYILHYKRTWTWNLIG